MKTATCWCGAMFDPNTDYDGNQQHGTQRVCCTREHHGRMIYLRRKAEGYYQRDDVITKRRERSLIASRRNHATTAMRRLLDCAPNECRQVAEHFLRVTPEGDT